MTGVLPYVSSFPYAPPESVSEPPPTPQVLALLHSVRSGRIHGWPEIQVRSPSGGRYLSTDMWSCAPIRPRRSC